MPTTVLFVDSFDHYPTADFGKKYQSASAQATASAGNGRNGTSSLRFTSGAGFNVTAGVLPAATLYCEVAVRVIALPTADREMLAFQDSGTIQCDLRLTATGDLRVTRNGTSLNVTAGLGMLANTYYHVGFMVTINDTTGVYEVRVNGVSVLTGSGVDTKNTANATANQVVLRSMAVSGNTIDYDDLVISADGWCGDCRVKAVFPDSAGNYSEWTPSAGLGWQCVDEPSMNSDTDYVSSATVGQRNSYGFGAVGLTGTVKAVQHVTSNRKDDAGSRTIKQFARIGGTDYDGSAVSVADAYVMSRRVMSVSPATGSAWTVSEIDSAEFGTRLES